MTFNEEDQTSVLTLTISILLKVIDDFGSIKLKTITQETYYDQLESIKKSNRELHVLYIRCTKRGVFHSV